MSGSRFEEIMEEVHQMKEELLNLHYIYAPV